MKNLKRVFAEITQKIKSAADKLWARVVIGIAYFIWGLGLVLICLAAIPYLIECMVLRINNGMFSVLFSRTTLLSIYLLEKYLILVSKEKDIMDDYFEENRLMIDVLKMMSEGRMQ